MWCLISVQIEEGGGEKKKKKKEHSTSTFKKQGNGKYNASYK